MKRADKREHLVDVAAALFNRHGYHAVGVDMVIAEAGVAKTTLYRHFPSKDDLIVAVLRRDDERFRDDIRKAVEAVPPADRPLATFDYLETWFAGGAFFGCPFIAAAGEYGQRSSPVFQEAAVHKRLMLAWFEELARGAGLPEPRRAAQYINLLHEGATAIAHIAGGVQAAREAKEAARRLLYP